VVINGICACNATDGYYYNANTSTCLSCSNFIPNCAVCQVNSSVVSCQTASPGYYVDPLSNLTILMCPTSCSLCTGPSTCTGCIAGYTLNSSTTVCDCINCPSCTTLLTGLVGCADCDIATNSCSLCIPGTFLNTSDSNCVGCPVGCSTCLSLSSCQLCTSPFVASVPAGSCQCNNYTGQYYNPNTFTCDSCSSIVTNCTNCNSLNYTTSCLSCATGTYLFNNTCVVCAFSCTLCTAASVCQGCIATFDLINSTCQCNASA
jgi:hypothetical protein